MIFLTEKERGILSKAPDKTYLVTYSYSKEMVTALVVGKACGVVPLADEVSIFAIYDEHGIERFVCDFSNFISVVEKTFGKLHRHKKASLSLLRKDPP